MEKGKLIVSFALFFSLLFLSSRINGQDIMNNFTEHKTPKDGSYGAKMLKKNNFSTTLGFGYHQHAFPDLELHIDDVNIGKVKGDFSTDIKNVVSFDIGIF